MRRASKIKQVNEFCEAACLNYTTSPYARKRENNIEYGIIRIVSKGHNFGKDWHTWWEPFVGIEIFALLEFDTCPYTNKKILSEAYPVRLTNTKMVKGRGIPARAFVLT